MRVAVLCFVVCLLSDIPAFAIPVTFDFSSSLNAHQSALGLDLTVEAASVGRTTAEIDWSAGFGFGVLAAPSVSGAKDSGMMDGSSSDDVLNFDFSSSVLLQEVVFTWVNNYDLFELWIGGDRKVFGLIDPAGAETYAYDFNALQLISGNFSLMAKDSKASFRVKSVTVDFSPLPTPEPSTWLLFCGGLVSLFFLRRRSG